MADEKKSSVKMGVKDEPKSINPGGKEILNAAKEKESVEAEKSVAPGTLISTNDHPVHVRYGDSSIRMSPRARASIHDVNLLDKQLPPGIHLKPEKQV